ncbi:hypothetical protein CRENBAI_003822 [Crenichthys baileyi]|uniref:Uncharacterized protein n=1 Tax=Crenichthys baileyi TaxID=28760 RepID=A0AAV9S1N5_9TELE
MPDTRTANHYFTLLHVIVVPFGSKLKGHVCLPARRYSSVLPLLPVPFRDPHGNRSPCWSKAFLFSSDFSSSWAELKVGKFILRVPDKFLLAFNVVTHGWGPNSIT